jgi:hypothetical protein
MTAVGAVQAAAGVVRDRALTIGQILAHQQPLMDLRTFFDACGIPESTGYQEAAKGALPIEVIRLGRRRYVRTVEVWRWLGLVPAGNDDDAGVAPPTPPVQQHTSTPTSK